MTNTRKPERAFLGISALVFAASAAVTVVWCSSMSAMPGMEMPGGWTMSMTWMRMPGQSWFEAAATFIGMWSVMMVAMMLPVLVPMLSRYRQVIRARPQLELLTAIAAFAYFMVWTLTGIAAYVIGLLLAEAAMKLPALARLAPVASGVIVLVAGVAQFTRWKARQLACCRKPQAAVHGEDPIAAWTHGLRLGICCVHCCLGHTAILLAIGLMDLRAMGLVAAAIAAERLMPNGERIARAIGTLVIAVGLLIVLGRAQF
jgi:predicted metal-binding membrane protein